MRHSYCLRLENNILKPNPRKIYSMAFHIFNIKDATSLFYSKIWSKIISNAVVIKCIIFDGTCIFLNCCKNSFKTFFLGKPKKCISNKILLNAQVNRHLFCLIVWWELSSWFADSCLFYSHAWMRSSSVSFMKRH